MCFMHEKGDDNTWQGSNNNNIHAFLGKSWSNKRPFELQAAPNEIKINNCIYFMYENAVDLPQ